MPYRRLPNTDNARYQALLKAYQKGKETPPFKLAFSQSTFQQVSSFLPSFEKTIIHQKSALIRQTDKNKEYISQMKKARLFISHFIQVVNMAIHRGELPSSIREYYNLNTFGNKLPPLNTEDDILKWGKNIIDGESQRIRKGQSPVTNPTIAVVKVRFENFEEAYNSQKNLQFSTARTLREVSTLRPKADEIIRNIWNEVEESFKDLPDDLRREKSMEYGLAYVYRKNELAKSDIFRPARQGIS